MFSSFRYQNCLGLLKHFACFLLLNLFFLPAFSQIITTVAGSGFNGAIGDGGPALSAGLPYPYGICFDPSGNLYVTCGNNVRKIAAGTGIITNFAGNGNYSSTGDAGLAVNASVAFPISVCSDNAGNIYIGEYGGNRVRKVSTSGIISTIAGNGSAGYSGDGGPAINAALHIPVSISADGANNIYIADQQNNRIRKVNLATGIITTIAGNGSTSFSGDGGLATSAATAHPAGVFADGSGNIFFAEAYSGITCRVRKIAAGTGIISTIAGNSSYAYSGDGGAATNASLFAPSAVIVDGSENIYISEYDDSRIRKVDAVTGIITTIAGTGTNGLSGDGGPPINAMLHYPIGLAFNSLGQLYVADNFNHRIRMITMTPLCTPTISIQSSSSGPCTGVTMTFTATATNEGTSPTYQWMKNGNSVGSNSATYSDNNLADGDGIYCKLTSNASCANGTVVNSNTITITGPGIINTIAGTGVPGFYSDNGPATMAALNFPGDLCIDASGNIYVADGANNRIRKINIATGFISTVAGTGTAGFSGDGGLATNAQLNLPTGVNLDAQGNLYIVDRDNNRIRKVNGSTGIITTIAGTGAFSFSGDAGLAVNASLKHPLHLILDASGNIYFTDRENNRVRKIDAATGIITTIAGNGSGPYSGDGGPATSASLYEPTKICFDLSGNLIIADWRNHRIRKVNSSGIITTIAGTGVSGNGGDGGPATLATLYFPNGIVYDAAGNLYIADVNHVIRKVDAVTGIIQKIAGTAAGFSGDGGPALNAKMNGPEGMAFDASGNLYVCDELNHRIRKISVPLSPASRPVVTLPPAICKGSNSTVTISSGSLNNATEWKWYTGSCGGTLAGTGTSIRVSPTATTTYYVRGEGNCVAPGECATVSLTVTDAALPSITISTSTPLHCFNVGSQFAATVTGSVSNPVYQWKRNGVNTGTNSPSYLGSLNVNDVITCELSGTNTCGGPFTVVSNGITIQSNPGYDLPPEVTTTATQQSICEGTSVTFVATNKSASANPQYQWQVNGVNAGTNNPTFSTSSLTNSASVTCIMTVPECQNSGSTKDYSDPITMTVYPLLNPSITIAATATTICKGSQVTFTAIASQGGNNPSYRWKVNGLSVGNNSATYATTTLNDGDIVTCEYDVDPSAQCVKNSKAVSNSIVMKVQSITAPSLQINGSQTEICSGTVVRFTAASDNPGIISSYQWQINGSVIGSGSSFATFNLNDGDKINCTATLSNGTCTNSIVSNNIIMVVHPSPSISFVPSSIIIAPGEQVQLKPIIQGDVTAHQWTPSNLLIDPSSLTPLTVPLSNTTSYDLLVTTAYGCIDNKTIIVAVYNKLYMPNSFTPNNDGHNDAFRIPPNVPFELKEFSIFDRWGNKVFSTKDASKGWDGRNNGILQGAGTYVYIIRGKDNKGGVFIKGTVTLIR